MKEEKRKIVRPLSIFMFMCAAILLYIGFAGYNDAKVNIKNLIYGVFFLLIGLFSYSISGKKKAK